MPGAFISYARNACEEEARALKSALGELAFQDVEDVEYGEHFPSRIADALLDADIVVVLADATYFTRWFCFGALQI